MRRSTVCFLLVLAPIFARVCLLEVPEWVKVLTLIVFLINLGTSYAQQYMIHSTVVTYVWMAATANYVGFDQAYLACGTLMPIVAYLLNMFKNHDIETEILEQTPNDELIQLLLQGKDIPESYMTHTYLDSANNRLRLLPYRVFIRNLDKYERNYLEIKDSMINNSNYVDARQDIRQDLCRYPPKNVEIFRNMWPGLMFCYERMDCYASLLEHENNQYLVEFVAMFGYPLNNPDLLAQVVKKMFHLHSNGTKKTKKVKKSERNEVKPCTLQDIEKYMQNSD